MKAEIDDYIAVTIFDFACEVPGDGVKRIDNSIAGIGDQNIVAKRAETSARLRYSPGSVQVPPGGESPDEISLQIENVHNAVPGSNYWVVLRGVL